MYALHLNDDLSISQVFTCSFTEYLRRLKVFPDLKWVSPSGFLEDHYRDDILSNPSRFIFIAGKSLWDGVVVDAKIRGDVVAIPLSLTDGLNGPDGGTVIVPDGVSHLLINKMVAAGGYGGTDPTVNSGSGAYATNIGLVVYPGQVITVSGLSGNNPDGSRDAACSTILSVDGTVVLELGGGNGAVFENTKTYIEQFIEAHPYNVPRGGAGGRWIRTQSPINCFTGAGSYPGPYYPPSNPDLPGAGGSNNNPGNPGQITGLFSNLSPSSYSSFMPYNKVYVNTTVPYRYPDSDENQRLQLSGPCGFGVTTTDQLSYIFIRSAQAGSGAVGASGKAGGGATITNLCVKAPAGTSVGGFIGGGGLYDDQRPVGSQPSGEDSWAYLQLPTTPAGVPGAIIPLFHLTGGNGQADITGVNDLTDQELDGVLGGPWTTGCLSYKEYQIADGPDGLASASPGTIDIAVCTEEYWESIDTASRTGYTVFNALTYAPITRSRPTNQDPAWTVSLSQAGMYSFQMPDWVNYVEIVSLSSGGGAGSSRMEGGSGAELTNALYAIPQESAITIRLGKGGNYDPTTSFQRNGDLTSLTINGKTVVSLTGGIGGAEDIYAVTPNFYPDWQNPYKAKYAFPSEGGKWLSRIVGTPDPVSFEQNVNLTGRVSPGGDFNSDGVDASVIVRFHKNRPSGYGLAVPLSSPTETNTTVVDLNAPNDAISTQAYTKAGTYQITVPDGCYAVCIDQLTGGQGGTSFLSPDFMNNWYDPSLINTTGFGENGTYLLGAPSGVLAGSWSRVSPGQTIEVVVGKGGQYSYQESRLRVVSNGKQIYIGKMPQPQGGVSTVSVLDSASNRYMLAGVDGGASVGDRTDALPFTSLAGSTLFRTGMTGQRVYYNSGTSYTPKFPRVAPAKTSPYFFITPTSADGMASISFHPRVDPKSDSCDSIINNGTIHTDLPQRATGFTDRVVPLYSNDVSDILSQITIPEGYHSFKCVYVTGASYAWFQTRGGYLYFGTDTDGPALSCSPGDTISLIKGTDTVASGTDNYEMVYTTADQSVTNVLASIQSDSNSWRASVQGKVVRSHPVYQQNYQGTLSPKTLTCTYTIGTQTYKSGVFLRILRSMSALSTPLWTMTPSTPTQGVYDPLPPMMDMIVNGFTAAGGDPETSRYLFRSYCGLCILILCPDEVTDPNADPKISPVSWS